MARIGIASIVQETNTFSPRLTTLDDFRSQSLHLGIEAAALYRDTNTEFGGALAMVERLNGEPVPLVHAWAMSSGRVTADALDYLKGVLRAELEAAEPLDALVLSLHGAMAAEGEDSADAVLLRTARDVVGPHVPIAVCLDLHANLTFELVRESDVLVGYQTYPHVDQAATGARTAQLVIDSVEGRYTPITALAKRPMIVPPEGQGVEGPFGDLRSRANWAMQEAILDVSLFPVQPWLDVRELGFGVTVTTDGDAALAQSAAEHFAELAWESRHDFGIDLLDPITAIDRVRRHAERPVLLSHSADSPTAGATGDSPAMIPPLLSDGADLQAYLTLVDERGVRACIEEGEGAGVQLVVGSSHDDRFHAPVLLQGQVRRLGDGPFSLTGPVFTGMEVSMGRWAIVDAGRLSVLLTERPACTFDPETFRHVGLPPEEADLIVIRSANLFRAGWAGVSDSFHILDLPGASTPRLETLHFERAPRPLFPLENV